MTTRDWLLKLEYDFILLFNKTTGSDRICYFMIDPRTKDRIFPKMNSTIFPKLRNLVCYRPLVLNGMLYIIGGKDWTSGEVSSATWRYHPVTGTWAACGNLLEPRCRHTVNVMDGKIIVTGGEIKQGMVTDTVEIYDPDSNMWTRASSLPRPRVDHASCVCNKRLYVSGGISNLKHQCSSVFWVYDVLAKKWTEPCPNIFLPDEREKHIMFPVKDECIYIMAGRGFDQELFQEKDEANVCCYWTKIEGTDTKYNHFDTEQPHISRNRVQPGYVSLGNRVYLFGGKNSQKDCEVTEVEYYIPKKRKWGTAFQLPRCYSYSNLDCVALTIPVHNKDFNFSDLHLYDNWVMW